LQSFRVTKFFRILNPYGLSPPAPSILRTLDGIAETASDIVLIVIMIIIVMVAVALVAHYIFADSLQYRCTPYLDASGNYFGYALNDSKLSTYGSEYFYSIYNDRYCGFDDGAATCKLGFNCTNIGISFSGGIADFADPGLAFIANLTFITLRGWGDLFYALIDANGPLKCFLLLLACIILVAEVFVNMISAVLANNLRKICSRDMKEMISKAFPGSKDIASELEILIWSFNSGVFIESSVEEDRILSNALTAITNLFKRSNSSEGGKNDKKNKKKSKKARKQREAVGASEQNVSKEGKEEPQIPNQNVACVPNCIGCDKLRLILASDGGPLSLLVIGFVLADTAVLAFDSSNPRYSIYIYIYIKYLNTKIHLAFPR